MKELGNGETGGKCVLRSLQIRVDLVLGAACACLGQDLDGWMHSPQVDSAAGFPGH